MRCCLGLVLLLVHWVYGDWCVLLLLLFSFRDYLYVVISFSYFHASFNIINNVAGRRGSEMLPKSHQDGNHSCHRTVFVSGKLECVMRLMVVGMVKMNPLELAEWVCLQESCISGSSIYWATSQKIFFSYHCHCSFDVLLQSGKIDHRSGTCPVRSSPVASLRDLRHNHHTIAV